MDRSYSLLKEGERGDCCIIQRSLKWINKQNKETEEDEKEKKNINIHTHAEMYTHAWLHTHGRTHTHTNKRTHRVHFECFQRNKYGTASTTLFDFFDFFPVFLPLSLLIYHENVSESEDKEKHGNLFTTSHTGWFGSPALCIYELINVQQNRK